MKEITPDKYKTTVNKPKQVENSVEEREATHTLSFELHRPELSDRENIYAVYSNNKDIGEKESFTVELRLHVSNQEEPIIRTMECDKDSLSWTKKVVFDDIAIKIKGQDYSLKTEYYDDDGYYVEPWLLEYDFYLEEREEDQWVLSLPDLWPMGTDKDKIFFIEEEKVEEIPIPKDEEFVEQFRIVLKNEKPETPPDNPPGGGKTPPKTTPYLESKVSIAEKTATALEALEVSGEKDKTSYDIGDTILYRNFSKNTSYFVQGKLYEVVKTAIGYRTIGEPIAVSDIEKVRTGEESWGEWDKVITFRDVVLKPEHRYVVYDYAIKAEERDENRMIFEQNREHLIKHEDPNDKAQTLFVKGPKEPPKPPENPPEEPEKPEEPEQPQKPEKPQEPEEPTPPSPPLEPEQPVSPKTYVGSLGESMVLLLLGLGAWLVLARKRREK